MLRIDLHIHTDPANYESDFNFSLEKLKEYVHTNRLQVIAITNHNHFNMSQFNTIQNSLNDITVLPGIEIDIERSHLLLIGNINQVNEIETASKLLIEEIHSEKDSISFEKFVELYPNYQDYILIPHYKKNPKMQISTINKFNGNIVCGEVRNAKQFNVIIKQNDKLVPVLFSDIRVKDDLEILPVRYTYIDISEFEFSALKSALSDKRKVFINNSKSDSELEILPDGTTASSGLNVIIGKRSSGKTYTLNRIDASNDSDHIKYVKQFSLTGKSEESKFNELVNNEQSYLIDEYLSPLKDLTNKVLDIDEFYDNEVDGYLSSLKDYAENQSLQDVYSKSKLFTESFYNANDNLDTKDVIYAVLKLLETEHNRDLIDSYIEQTTLKKLLKDLLIRREKEYVQFNLKNQVDEIINYTQKELSKKSSLDSLRDVDLYSIEKKRIMIEEYDKLCNRLKKPATIKTVDVYRFKIELNRMEFKKTTEIKNDLHIKNSIAIGDEFKFYNQPYRYIKKLENAKIDKNIIHKALIKFKASVLNERNAELSGGERAEYNLLHELKDAENYDVLLLDEPEASFDNLFIKDYIIDIIKKISNNTTVFLSTHNNTLGVLLKPNKIIYTEACGNGVYKVFTGDFGSRTLKTINEEKVNAFDYILNVMEAGEDAYNERKKIYENIRNKGW